MKKTLLAICLILLISIFILEGCTSSDRDKIDNNTETTTDYESAENAPIGGNIPQPPAIPEE